MTQPSYSRNRGAALLAAMLTVTLVATLATASLWQQWRAVEIEAADRSRVQSGWILSGAMDWSRLILIEDGRAGGADHLAEPWAIPLQEARLSSFLAADRYNTVTDSDTAMEAFLSGQINDAQGRLNVMNLIDEGKVSARAMTTFTKLFELLGLPQQQLADLAENLRLASEAATAEATPASSKSDSSTALLPQRIEQLVWMGLPPRTLTIITPFVTLLPVKTLLNVNTASPEALYAAVPTLAMATAQKLVTERNRSHFRTLGDAIKFAPEISNTANQDALSVTTRFFEVQGRLRIDDTTFQEHSLLQRDGLDVKILWRERGVLQENAAGGSTTVASGR
ncbi:MAG TPA: type II secretion system minor pseudopilin GspK [Burkholderiaceae bacterium]|jgi:general secretion pathway protein K|nr:type II secretion system minor pseudopilin GspK [Burkholderiaceae bacterium]